MVGMFLSALDQSIVGTALPRITSELGGLDKLSWVVTAYLLTQTASTPLWGKISDLYGRRLLFQVAIVTFLISMIFIPVYLPGRQWDEPDELGPRDDPDGDRHLHHVDHRGSPDDPQRSLPETYPGDSAPSGPSGASTTWPVAGSSPTSV